MGWKAAGSFNSVGLRLDCAGGTANAPGRTVIATRVCPSGARCVIERMSAKVADVGNADQIYFAIERNGASIGTGFNRIPGIEFDFQSQIEVGEELAPGTIDIVAYNISGMSTTIEPDALAVAQTIRCQAWYSGKLLAQERGR